MSSASQGPQGLVYDEPLMRKGQPGPYRVEPYDADCWQVVGPQGRECRCAFLPDAEHERDIRNTAYHEGQRSVIEVLRELREAENAAYRAGAAYLDSLGEVDPQPARESRDRARAAADELLSQHPNTLPHE